MIARVDAIIDRVGRSRRVIIPLLQALQAEFSYLPSDALQRVYERTEIDRAQMISVSTFYAQFSLSPKGENNISVCLGTACYVKGSQQILDRLTKELGIDAGECTPDGRFSLEACRCIGACGLAPVLTVNDEVYGKITEDDVTGILAKYKD